MMVQMARQDVLANNLANASTPGFKKDVAVSESFSSMLVQRLGEVQETSQGRSPVPPITIGGLGTGAAIAAISTDHSPGTLYFTGNQTDVALRSDGYFSIETPQGVLYTRDGTFHLNAEGRLVTADGYPVLGKDGYIEPKGEFTINEDGEVLADGQVVDVLQIVRFEEPRQLTKVGENMFQAPEGVTGEEVQNPQIMQGYLEASNVNAVGEMVDLITVVRAYELSQKAIQAEDEMLDKAVNQVGAL